MTMKSAILAAALALLPVPASAHWADQAEGRVLLHCAGGDLAGAARGKEVPELLTKGHTAGALRAAMGGWHSARAKRIIRDGWIPSPPVVTDEFVVVSGCSKRNCDASKISVAFDRRGGAWAAIKEGEHMSYHGKGAPSEVVEAMTPKDQGG